MKIYYCILKRLDSVFFVQHIREPPVHRHSADLWESVQENLSYQLHVVQGHGRTHERNSAIGKRVGLQLRACGWGLILTAGKKVESENTECNNSGYKLTGLTWWP